MIVVQCEQRSEEWLSARLGIPTASEFDKIIMPATGKASTSADAYMFRLLGEWMTGKQQESFQSGWMERGSELEPEARAYYELQTDGAIQQVGFVYRDESRMVGCSPDGLLPGGGVEFKCPSAGMHVRYLLSGNLANEYIPQVQGAMWITGAEWWDWMSYHPDMEPSIVRVLRDPPYIAKLETLMSAFIEKMVKHRAELIARGFKAAA